jgi:hypothetical protein
LIAFPRKKLHKLLDIVVRQIEARNLAGVGPHSENVVQYINSIDDQEGTIAPTNNEPPRPIFHRLLIPYYPLYE